MVGAVLVYEDRVIGEGYHRTYGQAHAEVNCIASVKESDRRFIPEATLYVSLEPCAHHGKTPPCADLVIEKKIPRVVIGCRDPFPQVNGKGIEKLVAAGVEVRLGVLEKECVEVNRRFFTFNTLHRPYIVLKWAQSANRMIAAGGGDPVVRGGAMGRTPISNEYTNRLVHRWRSEEAAILVGTHTALLDDPSLTVRLWKGADPVRLVVDKELRLPLTLKVFDGSVRTIVFNTLRHEEGGYGSGGNEEGGHGRGGHQEGGRGMGGHADAGRAGGYAGCKPEYYQLAGDSSLVQQIVVALHRLKIQSVLVEGGARLLQSFIDEGYWDAARVITNTEMEISGGLASPVLKNAVLRSRETIFSDTIRYYENKTRPAIL
jgi:diaminohydroxyphosphoribosylaminopyrimidine deaminase/5-amino-6-(5-phosphoribosylamino)uracil reductase